MLKQKQKPVWRHCLSSVGKKNNIGEKIEKVKTLKNLEKKTKGETILHLKALLSGKAKDDLNKYILQLEQIHLTIWTNTFYNLNKYI